MIRKAVVSVCALAVAAAGLGAQPAASLVGAAAACSTHHQFGAQPVDVAKTADGRVVLATIAWQHHPSIGCYLVLDEGATAVLRAATPPSKLPTGKTAASQLCGDHHKFGEEPADVAKTADGGAVLARLVWNWHDTIGCYLTLDAEAVAALQAAHVAQNKPEVTPEPEPETTPEPAPDPGDALPATISGWALDRSENDDGAITGYERRGTRLGGGAAPWLDAYCYGDYTAFHIRIWSDFPLSRSGSDESVDTSYRLPGEQSRTARWWAADVDFTAVFPHESFVDEALAAGPGTLGVTITGADGAVQSLSFDMAGFDEVISALSGVCPVPLAGSPDDSPADTEPGATPVAPTVSVIRGDDGAVVSWIPGGDGGSDVTSWQFQVDGGDWVDLTASGHPLGVNALPVRGLDDSIEHTFGVRGVNDAGVGESGFAYLPAVTPALTVVTVPAADPSGRCASAIASGVYQWEQCAWADYWEDTAYNRSLSDAEARTLIGRIWAEVGVDGKPTTPPTAALIPAGSECATSVPGGGFIIGCYQSDRHHIRRLDSFLETLLHEVAHALVANHLTVTACRGITDDDDYQACAHNDVFRCVANHLYMEYAGIPDAGVCGTAPETESAGPQQTRWGSYTDDDGDHYAWVDASWHNRPSPHEDSAVELVVRCSSDGTDLDVFFWFDGGNLEGDADGDIPVAHVFLPEGFSEWGSERQRDYVTDNRSDNLWGESTNNRAAFLPLRFHEDFLNDAVAHDSVLIRAWNPDDTVFGMMAFSLEGAYTHIKAVTERCGWTWTDSTDSAPVMPSDGCTGSMCFNGSSWGDSDGIMSVRFYDTYTANPYYTGYRYSGTPTLTVLCSKRNSAIFAGMQFPGAYVGSDSSEVWGSLNYNDEFYADGNWRVVDSTNEAVLSSHESGLDLRAFLSTVANKSDTMLGFGVFGTDGTHHFGASPTPTDTTAIHWFLNNCPY